MGVPGLECILLSPSGARPSKRVNSTTIAEGGLIFGFGTNGYDIAIDGDGIAEPIEGLGVTGGEYRLLRPIGVVIGEDIGGAGIRG